MKKTDYNRLAPHHFRQEPKPNEGDFDEILRQGDGFVYDTPNPEYEKALQEWERKYQEPEYDWIKFEDQYPKENTKIAISYNGIDREYVIFAPKKEDKKPESITYWACMKEYNTRLTYWQEHQVLFEGWEQESESVFKKGEVVVVFNTRDIFITSHHLSYFNVNLPTCSVELFKSICKENEIEL